jgi:peptidoglycan L-alanyl-D-glutamate endopeptidase CwlK
MPIVSRSLSDLSPETRIKAVELLRKCEVLGLDVLVTCTYRDSEAQAELYAIGRTKPGSIVTNAKPGQSLHNYVDRSFEGLPRPASEAFDCVPMVAGKPLWSTTGDALKVWRRLGELGEACGLQWAGRWSGKLREFAHFQNR